MSLPTDILKNILSDYIEYDQLIEYTKSLSFLRVNSYRITADGEIMNNIKIMRTYIDGDIRKIEGFFNNGDKAYYISSKNNKLEGRYSTWYNNGNIMWEFNYKNGEKDETQYQWYENGTLETIKKYQEGKEQGKQYQWNSDGSKYYELTYLDGKMDGNQYYWNHNGDLSSIDRYENGEWKETQNTGILGIGSLRKILDQETEFLIYSYLSLDEVLEVFEGTKIRDKILHRYFLPLPTIDDVCEYGDLKLIKGLLTLERKEFQITQETLEIATSYGHWDIIEFIIEEIQIFPNTRTLDFAVLNHQFEIAECFYHLGVYPSGNAIYYGKKGGIFLNLRLPKELWGC